jgi:hypothetical protein
MPGLHNPLTSQKFRQGAARHIDSEIPPAAHLVKILLVAAQSETQPSRAPAHKSNPSGDPPDDPVSGPFPGDQGQGAGGKMRITGKK